MWFTATKPGRYHIFCTQYCGTKHSAMIGWVTVMEPAEYQAWLGGGAAGGSMAENGAKLFQDLACSDVPPRERRRDAAPSLKGAYGKHGAPLTTGQTVIADDAYIRESILQPQAKIVAGYANDHADVPGARDRRADCSSCSPT